MKDFEYTDCNCLEACSNKFPQGKLVQYGFVQIHHFRVTIIIFQSIQGTRKYYNTSSIFESKYVGRCGIPGRGQRKYKFGNQILQEKRANFDILIL